MGKSSWETLYRGSSFWCLKRLNVVYERSLQLEKRTRKYKLITPIDPLIHYESTIYTYILENLNMLMHLKRKKQNYDQNYCYDWDNTKKVSHIIFLMMCSTLRGNINCQGITNYYECFRCVDIRLSYVHLGLILSEKVLRLKLQSTHKK